MTLEELGAVLRAEREKRGLSIEDAANHLKIGARLLRALEAGDTSSLPHLAYTKGFIRSYSSYVGLSTEEVSAALAALEASNEETTVQQAPMPDITLAPRRSMKPFLSAFVVVLLGVGAYAAWQHGALEFLTSQTRRMAQPAPMQSPDTADTSSLGAGSRSVAANRESRQGASAGQSATAAADNGTQAARSATSVAPAAPGASAASGTSGAPAAPGTPTPPAAPVAPAAPAAPVAAAPTGAAATQTPVTGPHKLIITATEECWVHSNADNTDTRQFSLRKGDTFALTFNKSLELKLGNAGGVRLRYDGEELPPAGASGQVRTLTFPPALP
ncbi:helix-turn-helix domain-containing protein [Desulfovibrio intestinalis]|uniref:Cytoskeleton protein RodZ n=1 Tax=Desulfovibrio intestinalis TaxID=58621 RepID=A0A7W8FF87_9BACT|nr:helix-turn-helix domain-containing protein [Desulfovibrio intestinalis]MBB5142626.1 cytoskeleton protein RodZ [Desulfovibrio intestinalis]